MTDRATGTLCRIFAWHADQGVLQRNTTTRTPLLLLALALLAVASAPLLDLAASRLRGGRAGLDGFVLVAVSGLVLLHVLPHAIRLGGPVVIGFAALGLFLPLAIESWTREAAQSAHAWALRLALLGLVAHATLDGAALYNGHEPELALAVILHRIPAALAVWVLVRPGRGAMVAWSLLGAMILATVVGWGLGPALHNLDDRLLGMFSGLVSGSLLHVVVHRPHHHPLPEEARTGGVGALLGVVAVGIPLLVEAREPPLEVAYQVAIAAGPPLILAAALAGLLRQILPHPTGKQLARTRTALAAVWGLARPCTGDEIDALDGGSAGEVAFTTAARGVGIASFPIAAAVLGPAFAVALLASSGALAVTTGLFLASDVVGSHPAPQPAVLPLRGVAVWLIVGIGLTPMAATMPAMAIAPLVLLAAPLRIHPVAAILIAAGLAAAGTETGALLAMILAATTTGLPTVRTLRRRHGTPRSIAALGGTCFFATGIGILVHPTFQPIMDPIGTWSLPVVGVLVGAAVLIEGPRGLLENLRQVPHHHAHS